jgi:hypothetical protein
MRKRGGRSLERTHSRRRTNPSQHGNNGVELPCRIPGVRIAYIGEPTSAAEEIGAYWRRRGATFAMHRVGQRSRTSELDPILERADIVFLATDCVDPETGRRLEACCARLERALVLLDEGSLPAVERALTTWYPLAHP